MLKDSRVDNYLNNLGQRLFVHGLVGVRTAHAPGYKFPYTFKAMNDRAINAFAPRMRKGARKDRAFAVTTSFSLPQVHSLFHSDLPNVILARLAPMSNPR
jgi:hypothetical protein